MAATRLAFEEKREVYARLNSLARNSRNTVKDYVRPLAANKGHDAKAFELLRQARYAYQDQHDIAQMILPSRILSMASDVNIALARAFHFAEGIDDPDGKAPQEVYDFCEGHVLDAIARMRAAMREDLGVH